MHHIWRHRTRVAALQAGNPYDRHLGGWFAHRNDIMRILTDTGAPTQGPLMVTPQRLRVDWHCTVRPGVPSTALDPTRPTYREQAARASGRGDGFGSRQGVRVDPGLDRADAHCDGNLHHAAAQSRGGPGGKRERPCAAAATPSRIRHPHGRRETACTLDTSALLRSACLCRLLRLRLSHAHGVLYRL